MNHIIANEAYALVGHMSDLLEWNYTNTLPSGYI